MKSLVSKNLIVHRDRNQLTAIIQSLTLASTIFIISMLNLESIQLMSYNAMAPVDLYVYDLKYEMSPEIMDPVIQQYLYGIKDFTYITTGTEHPNDLLHLDDETLRDANFDQTTTGGVERFYGVGPSEII